MYKYFNPNPKGGRVGDCTVRALTKALDMEWPETYIDLCLFGLLGGDMPSANNVWGSYLRSHGFSRYVIPNTCPDCYTVADFAREHDAGVYVLALEGHVVAVCDGCYWDSWDSGGERPLYYWTKEAIDV